MTGIPELPERPRWTRTQQVMVAGIVLGVVTILTVMGWSLTAVRALETELRASDDAAEQFVAVMRQAGRVQVAILRTDDVGSALVTEELAVLERHVAVMRTGITERTTDARLATRVTVVLGAHRDLAAGTADRSLTAAEAQALAGAVERTAKAAADVAETGRRSTLLAQVATARAVTLGTIGAVGALLLVIGALLVSVRNRSVRAYAEAYEVARAHATDLEATNRQLVQANETKHRFLSMVSHELRTPLTVIRGFAETLARHGTTLGEAQRDDLAEAIVRQSLRQQRMVEDLLVLARHTEHAPEPTPMAFEVRPFLEQVLRDVVPGEVEVEVLPGPRCMLWADPHHLGQVLENLVTNAVKYGGPSVEVSWAHTADRCVLVVEDDGAGVPDDFVPSLFDPFAQADDGDTRVSRGVGLGLTITQLLVQANGGSIRYRHRDGGGARFEVLLPLATDAAVLARRLPAHSTSPA